MLSNTKPKSENSMQTMEFNYYFAFLKTFSSIEIIEPPTYLFCFSQKSDTDFSNIILINFPYSFTYIALLKKQLSKLETKLTACIQIDKNT